MLELRFKSLENLTLRIKIISPVLIYCTIKILIALEESYEFKYLCPSNAESSKEKNRIY